MMGPYTRKGFLNVGYLFMMGPYTRGSLYVGSFYVQGPIFMAVPIHMACPSTGPYPEGALILHGSLYTVPVQENYKPEKNGPGLTRST